ncbi:MAG: histidine ammonia-lyase [Candidatus Wallbacteria bacterium]|nr:histidine ammonia-lyase [Candidatus Wallbacteria bacterium]
MDKLVLNGHSLSFNEAGEVAFLGREITIDQASLERVSACSVLIDRIVADGKPVYGINTGFGSLKDVAVPADHTRELQLNLLRSHAAGWGDPLSYDITRAMILLRVNALLQGHSGIRPPALILMERFLNLGLYPFIPSRGSVGASGDLAPLSHLALCLIGEGEFLVAGERRPAAEILAENDLQPVRLEAKEGLALINGTQLMTAMALKILTDLRQVLNISCLSTSMSLEALMGTRTAFRPELHALRPHKGQISSADLIYRITENSGYISSHCCCGRVQDPYSLRCAPQVLGAAVDTYSHCRSVVETELNSVTDNPVILDSGEIISGGNFHGEPIAMILDFLSIAMTEVGSITERRIERMINHQLSDWLPPFLVKDCGLNSGFMIVQYLAAALVSECKSLSHPGSVDSIPTSANQEDHVSMGPVAGFKAMEILDRLKTIVGLELLTSAQALDFFTHTSSPLITELRALIRSRIDFLEHDRPMYKDIEIMRLLIDSHEVFELMERGNLPLID